jgi:hypothetical protein
MFEKAYQITYAILKNQLIFAQTTYLTCKIYKPL